MSEPQHVKDTVDDLGNAVCECGHGAINHHYYGCRSLVGQAPWTCRCQRPWPEALISSGLLDRIRADAARDALTEAADLIAPYGGIGMGSQPTRSEISDWFRDRAARIGGAS